MTELFNFIRSLPNDFLIIIIGILGIIIIWMERVYNNKYEEIKSKLNEIQNIINDIKNNTDSIDVALTILRDFKNDLKDYKKDTHGEFDDICNKLSEIKALVEHMSKKD